MAFLGGCLKKITLAEIVKHFQQFETLLMFCKIKLCVLCSITTHNIAFIIHGTFNSDTEASSLQ